ncbi:MAG: methenyltetrahydromethanopterin cyclohydrolase, partial [Dongiaceae bacterium]
PALCMADAGRRPSVNCLAVPLVQRLIDEADSLRIAVETAGDGPTIIDAGIARPGGIAAGLRIAEICMAGLGRVSLTAGGPLGRCPWQLSVHAADPVLACLGSQYAGWQLSVGEGKDAFHALGSGPGRALAQKEPLFAELGYKDRADRACLVLEVDKRPPAALTEKIASDCGIAPSGLTLILTPTQSLAGTVQIVARVLEVALHKLHELKFPLDRVIDGMGAAPLPPPAPFFVQAMGRTNDAIIYGGSVQLFVSGPDADARQLAEQLPSAGSRDFGRPFSEIFDSYKGDFYAMDRLLFSPAAVTVTALDSGRSFTAGRLDEALIDRSFGYGAST